MHKILQFFWCVLLYNAVMLDAQNLSGFICDTVIHSHTLDSGLLVKDSVHYLPLKHEPNRIKPDTTLKLPGGEGERLRIRGWKTLDFNTGNTMDNGLQQSMYLSLEGQISRHYRLSGVLKDYQTPMSEYQEGQTLRSLDQVYLVVQGPELTLKMGDFFQEKNRLDFLPDRQKIQGLEVVYHSQKVSIGRARGQYAVSSFNGQDGNQGPYYLSAENGNRYIVIIPESEKIYRNGQLLSSGDNQDYTLDYLSAAIHFNPSRMIGSEDRFYVEFEYTSLNYDRYMAGTHVSFRNQLSLDYYRSSDQIDSDLSYTLSESDKRAMSQLSNGSDYIFFSGVDTVAEGDGDYSWQDDHFLYVGQNGKGRYRVGFYYAGSGQGDYTYSGNNRFVFSGLKKGEYLPGKRVATPQTREYYQMDYRGLQPWLFQVSGTLSRYSPNNQSGFHQTGYWIKSTLQNQSRNLGLDVMIKDRSFPVSATILPAEHARIYNYPQSEELGSLRWANLISIVRSHQLGLSWFQLNENWEVYHLEHTYNHNMKSQLSSHWSCQNWYSQTFDRDTRSTSSFLHSQITLTPFSQVGWNGMIEYKPRLLFPGDSNYFFLQNQVFVQTPFPPDMQSKFSSGFRREEFYHDSIQSMNNYSLTFEEQIQSQSGSDLNFNLLTSYRYKRYTTSQQNEDFYLILFSLKRNREKTALIFDWQHQSGIEESYLLARRFKSVGGGTGNFRYDSLLQDYVPDNYGDFVLIKEILKNSQTLAGAQEDFWLQLKPGYWYSKLRFLEISHRHGMEIKTKQKNPLLRGLLYPVAGFEGSIHTKQHNWQTDLTFHLSPDDSISRFFSHQLHCIWFSNRSIQAYYQDYFQSQDHQSLALKWIGNLTAHQWDMMIEKGEKNQNWMTINPLTYDYLHSQMQWNYNRSTFSAFQTGCEMTWYDLKPSGRIRQSVLRETIFLRFYRSIHLTLQAQWDYLSQSGNQGRIHYYIASGRQTGSNWEYNLNISQSVSQKTEMAINLTLRNYASQPSQTFVRMSWKSYF